MDERGPPALRPHQLPEKSVHTPYSAGGRSAHVLGGERLEDWEAPAAALRVELRAWGALPVHDTDEQSLVKLVIDRIRGPRAVTNSDADLFECVGEWHYFNAAARIEGARHRFDNQLQSHVEAVAAVMTTGGSLILSQEFRVSK